MIGVVSKNSEITAVREFFQLFKTPWEFYAPRHAYDIVVVTCEEVPDNLNASALVIYNSKHTGFDDEIGIATLSQKKCAWLESDAFEFPVYGDVAVLQGTGQPFIRRREQGEFIGLDVSELGRRSVRIGYDLFQEVAFLLSHGQPPENAHIPTLDIHISLLRNIMLSMGFRFVEIPPVPAGYEYMACLTHDVDFTGIREHKLDYTMWGFIYRGLVGSLFDAIRGRIAWSKCRMNWKAVLSLPFVHLGWKDDFWLEFDRYMEIEKGLGSTFYFIPFKNYPGTRESDLAPKRRAAKYDLGEIKEQVHKLVEHRCEVGLHGIDAWQDSTKAQAEVSRIRRVTDQLKVGVRMHWLYFSEGSPKALEEAGISYDSTFGYNDAVGFRAGTSQAFRPLGVEELLELPLNIQDTALFYPGRMHLSEREAMDICKQLMGFMGLFGGALTVNWHTRSLSPERLWGDFYTKLLSEMHSSRVWFGTAQEIVTWFRKRRALRFDDVHFTEDGVRLRMSGLPMDGQPPLLVRVHHPSLPRSSNQSPSNAIDRFCSDIPWKGETELNLLRWAS